MATKYLKTALEGELKSWGSLGEHELQAILKGWLGDIEVLKKLIEQKLSVLFKEEDDGNEIDSYYGTFQGNQLLEKHENRMSALEKLLKLVG